MYYKVSTIFIKVHVVIHFYTNDMDCGLKALNLQSCRGGNNNPPADGGQVVLEEPVAANPPASGTQSEIDLYFFKKHAPALSRVLACVEENPRQLYSDEEAFASFVYNCLSTTIRKGAWRIGRNKKLVSQLFTPYDEALALLIVENNCIGIKEFLANGPPADRKKTKIKTKYTCKGTFKRAGDGTRVKKGDGGHGWTKAGMRRFVELTQIVEESRGCGRRMILEQRIKDSYVIRRAGVAEEDDIEDDDADEDEDSDSEPVNVCTGIPI